MKRISDEMFVGKEYDVDKAVAMRVKNGEFYFLALIESEPRHKIWQATSLDGYHIDKIGLIIEGDIYASVQDVKEYKDMRLLYLANEDNISDDECFYEMFLSLVYCKEEHDILMLSKAELSSICDILRDGDYIFIVEE